jgi:protein involved in polysaccharide export with SLBB domain
MFFEKNFKQKILCTMTSHRLRKCPSLASCDKGAKAYKDIDVKGYMKIPGTDDILFENMTPGEALDKLKELYKNKKIPCK